MGKKDNYRDDELSAPCKICDEDILIDDYSDRGDIIVCEECESEYVIKSLDPVVLFLIEDEDEDDENESEEDYFFDDDYFGDEYEDR